MFDIDYENMADFAEMNYVNFQIDENGKIESKNKGFLSFLGDLKMNTDFFNNCFSPNWLEVKEVENEPQRKSLEILLKELDEIKEGIERTKEKQFRLSNLMKFYSNLT